ncbi:MAG: hypothetical protein HY056_15460 [Proteobacteria bacterium]|nr:hypothetical protein [Pseudomonadota bacterium]
MTPAPRIEIVVSAGELVDKITILEIKAERITDCGKRANVLRELAELSALGAALGARDGELAALRGELKAVNETLWQVEDDIRSCERRKDFAAQFIALARSVYRHNDRRAAIKRAINERVGSAIVEEKSYADYD